MTKRRASDGHHGSSYPVKKCRLTTGILTVSDEILIRILSCLPVPDLLRCELVNRQFRSIAGDHQLWRPLYHQHFVQPRLDRIRRSKTSAALGDPFVKATRRHTRWLDEDSLVQPGNDTRWKLQYKLRHNWAKGLCSVSELKLARPHLSPLIFAKLRRGLIFTVDAADGLRALSHRSREAVVAQLAFPKASGNPTCMAFDEADDESDTFKLAVGFDSGQTRLYKFRSATAQLVDLNVSGIARASEGVLAVAMLYPYIASMTRAKVLRIDRISTRRSSSKTDDGYISEQLALARSDNVRDPLALSLRKQSSNLVVSVAYCLSTVLGGWSAGVQEIVLTAAGRISKTRAATAIDTSSFMSPIRPVMTQALPTFLSYSHPYLLVSHSDNTMMLYLINSGPDGLSIGPGKRLWGHTSGIFSADIGRRGRAVSVGSSGGEIRVWDLEASVAGTSRSHRSSHEASVEARPKNRRSPVELITKALGQGGHGLAVAADDLEVDKMATKGWVGFDEELVVLLRERASGYQSLAVYDFS